MVMLYIFFAITLFWIKKNITQRKVAFLIVNYFTSFYENQDKK